MFQVFIRTFFDPPSRRSVPALWLCLCLAAPAAAQTGTIRGTVQDADAQPLPGVHVVVAGTPRGTATDAAGRYRLEGLPAGEHLLAVSAVGFRRAERTVRLAPGDTLTVNFVLEEVVLQSGEVVVTASRRAQLSNTAPVSLSVMTPRELETRNVVALDEALRYVPGVQVQENQVNVRGASGFAYNTGSRVLLLLDGATLLTPDSDGLPLDALPMAQVEQIEVLKGPGSALYGSGALGGVVHVITKPFPETPSSSIRLFGGVYEPVRYALWREKWDDAGRARPFGGATLTHARRLNDRLGFWFNLAYRADTGYLNFSRLWLVQGYAKVGYRPRPGLRLDVLAGLLARERDNFLFWNGGRDALNPGNLSFTPGTSPTGTNDAFNNQFSLLPAFTHVVSEQVFYTLKARLFAVVIRPIDDVTGKPRSVADGTLGFRYGGETQVNWQVRPGHHLTTGASFDANLTRSSFYVTTDGDELGGQPEAALFAQWEATPGNHLQAVAGLRFDAYRIDAAETVTRLSPKLNLAYTPGPSLTLRAAFGQGFRVPSLAERFTDNRDFFPIARNPELRPEESTSVEAGLRTLLPLSRTGGIRLDLALFWNDLANLIEPKFVPERRAFQFVNLTRARIRGLEAALDLDLADERVRTRLGYTFLDANDRTAGAPLPFRPRHLLLASLDARLIGPLEAGFDYRFASRPERVESDFARFVPDADLLVDTRVLDLRLAVRHDGLHLAFLVKNALEYYYLERPAYLAAPRNYTLRLQWTH
ncbi:MAG: hypothetical protein KatS3mg043_1565 [Rhodothermaceae bacterium]|nr:MAG: hypothetical protein KatS3mg043_1565 [Rhodothermaceae bacterium]